MEQLRKLREEADLRQTDLAYICGWNQGHVSQLENNTQNPAAKTVFVLAHVLGVSADELNVLTEEERQELDERKKNVMSSIRARGPRPRVRIAAQYSRAPLVAHPWPNKAFRPPEEER